MSLEDRVIVITGASSGIGAATAIACGAAGMRVVLHARRADRLEEVAKEVRGRGGDAETVVGDVTDAEHAAQLLDAAESAFGGIDAVFSNAGYGLLSEIAHEPEHAERLLWDVNYFASARLLREAARRWIARERAGHLLVCSSCLARFSLPLYGSYAATKAAQASIAAALRFELTAHRIHVSSVHPITTSSEFFAQMTDAPAGTTPEHTPSRFVQTPDVVARAVVRCLRRPRPEVWTSPTVRLMSGVFAAFPGFAHWMLERQTRAELKGHRGEGRKG